MEAPYIHRPCSHQDRGEKGWRGRLTLRYAAAGNKTVLQEQRHTGPLMVQKPFYPEGPQTCHTYLIHPPGGIVGGDSLGLEVDAAAGGHAVITTPAAGKFYRSAGPLATQINNLNIASDTALEWLPQETIIYNRARVDTRTIVKIEPGAKFIGWELICLGLPASGQPFTQGQVDQRFEIWQGHRPVLVERFGIKGRDPVLSSPWGLAGRPVTGTMVATTGEHDLRQAVRDKTAKVNAKGLFAVTRINGLTICRFLGDGVYCGLKFFIAAWEVLRPAVMGRDVCRPRIWAT
ncbi:MAG: urease accessory protein UreD [Desulfobacteraceae bacterium]